MQCLGKSIRFRKPLTSAAETFNCEGSERARSEQPLDSVFTCEDADFGVRAVGEVPELCHVAEHEPLAAIETRKDFDTRAHGAGVGVVGVVDQPSAIGSHLELQPACHCAHGAEPSCNMFELRTCGSRCGRNPSFSSGAS